MPAASSNPFLIVDGHAYAYRAFHAIRSLLSPRGQATNAIYGFIKMLGKMRNALVPTHLCVVWDGGLSAERRVLLPGYKAQRPPMPDDLEWQIEALKGYLVAAGVSSLCHEGVEADDWIGALATCGAAEGLEVVIASSDKDFMQLVGERVRLLNPNDKREQLWGDEQVRVKTGVLPNQIVDWLSLMGDAVDNVPGVPGVGPKTATELLLQFGSVEGIYARLAELKSERLRGALQAARQDVYRNLQVIKLHETLPEPFDEADFRLGSPDTARLRNLFDDWGFKGLRKELDDAVAEQPELIGLST